MKVLNQTKTKRVLTALMQYMDSTEPTWNLVLELIYGGKNAIKNRVSLNRKYPHPGISSIRSLWADGKVKEASMRMMLMRYSSEDDILISYNNVTTMIKWNSPFRTIEIMANELV